jgi:hypothetical protein
VRDIQYEGEAKFTSLDKGDGIETINERAEESVSDYEFGPTWLPGKNIAGQSGPSEG